MEGENLRYTGLATTHWYYMKEFIVECPKCSKDAVITFKDSGLMRGGALRCSNCFHSEDIEDRVRYNIIIKRNCDNCGKPMKSEILYAKEKADKITVPCPHCGITRTYVPRNEKVLLKYENEKKAGEPIFNLPLWYQMDIKGNLFWAYNGSHLSEIEDYVKSKLRERQTVEYTTMVERLPNFIKEAKSRDAIIKGIQKLKVKS